MFDLKLPGVEGSERGGFVIFMQEAVPLHHPLHARPRAGVVLHDFGVNVLVQTTRLCTSKFNLKLFGVGGYATEEGQ